MDDIDRAGGTTATDGDAERHGERDWEDLVATALLGTERRGGSPRELLGAAAVRTVRRRAGLRPAEA
ncbi:hypothetical protein ACFXJO_42475, partial [Streptomyces lavendulae]|uniref:hypothetical protein n=1 Tax=Streptomyces lavendulae TaxID=1914 RepID=UPI003679F223